MVIRRIVGGMLLAIGIGHAPGAQASETIRFACTAASSKVGDLAPLCRLFEKRLASAYPRADLRLGEAAEADIVLVVDSAGPYTLVARVDWRGRPQGEALGTARRGAPLDDAGRASLLDSLLSASPR
jgi:hypothetical protein